MPHALLVIPISMTRNSEREYTVVQCMAGERDPNEKGV